MHAIKNQNVLNNSLNRYSINILQRYNKVNNKLIDNILVSYH